MEDGKYLTFIGVILTCTFEIRGGPRCVGKGVHFWVPSMKNLGEKSTFFPVKVEFFYLFFHNIHVMHVHCSPVHPLMPPLIEMTLPLRYILTSPINLT